MNSNGRENRVIRDAIQAWVKQDQKHIVLSALVRRKVGASTADQLVRDKYPREPQGEVREVIMDELFKAGVLADKPQAS